VVGAAADRSAVAICVSDNPEFADHRSHKPRVGVCVSDNPEIADHRSHKPGVV
jgi:hypothetical protein